ncbi:MULTISPECIES: hypothetical protein [unclassified Streptomyces]|uniref:hypothetical protein n=1 Tax=unclassified Streptomyces TaxID=2593676 RepID=UPI001BE6C9E9|nr:MULTISPECIES: hypothetical protein [unclassified Streptomyces]MBT2406597.1 hypothetical protein [Streptomyces sp. ISL-21]MBT2458065.1 hypothetical protein [Streptomyces sp. ISL-86]MBT2608935.1 hypothetical protein [Streptomyces sp. ISL-87]
MSAQLREIANELADVLWREHTVYRTRAGGVVIRGEHVQRWISLAPSAGRDEVLVRAGRILDGGTTAPARSEAVARLSAGTAELAAVCRRLLAETAPGPSPAAPRAARAPRQRQRGRSARRGRHTSARSWLVVACMAAIAALYVANGAGML